MSSSATLPAIYSFPPFFTRQPNALIRKQQITSWIEVILQYCKLKKCWSMTVEGSPVEGNPNDSNINPLTGGTDNSIFTNSEIQRSVPQVFVEEIWCQMCEENKAVGADQGPKDSSRYYILWRNFDSWASLVLQWFEDAGKLNQVVTIYELTQGDETMTWEFHGMPEQLMAYCLKPLEQRNRATLINDERGKPIAVKVV
ncbi:hypothetical protein HG535_0B05030 [Zygotorulaspora mrakii]|uniref:ESCRT-II complex subunit VPS25 n=1 Tax=Zygotorulaspora mrakii TaxID=42260 RepID=A0A7H9AYS2_ZYGMR|nr:uncharacterized protein HG535_0B05030 [Zygotorulaspora mrakii]QLG71461.1 hypothetical protein HG535_0B05030 [Zygotorulaspora mrakii]